jgi:hypothetical protein
MSLLIDLRAKVSYHRLIYNVFQTLYALEHKYYKDTFSATLLHFYHSYLYLSGICGEYNILLYLSNIFNLILKKIKKLNNLYS